MPFHPKVSVIIPVYNGSNYLAEAIDSALAQTYKNIEVIVINDGSGDDGATESIAKSYKDKIRYFSKPNGGVSTALNLGIHKMTGEYFSWLSHDDIYMKEKVATQIEYLSGQVNKNIVLYSDFEIIDSVGKLTKKVEIGNLKSRDFVFEMILSHPIQGCSALVAHTIFDDIGLFDPLLKTTQDYDMWFRIAQKYNFVHQDKVLVKSRVHPNQGTSSMKTTFIEEGNNLFLGWLGKIKVEDPHKYFDFSVALTKRCYLKAGARFFAAYSKSSSKNGTFLRNYVKFTYFKLLFGAIIFAQNIKYTLIK